MNTSAKLCLGKTFPFLLLTAALSLSAATNLQSASTPFKTTPSIVPTLLTTFTNPMPEASDLFGYSVAAVGIDRVLIGAFRDDTGAIDSGVAYLLSTNGALLATFTNPTPEAGDWFGNSVAAVGTDRILIGAFHDDTGAADAGAAYLFSTNGALLTSFTNPTPANSDYFGYCVAAVGTHLVLIGADQDDTGVPNAGAAYLFSTNGALLTTFTNPTPAANDNFGHSVAAVGTDRVLIGAIFADIGAVNAGAAYLFSTNGALITTFPSPSRAASDAFGISVAAMGTGRVLIGAPFNFTGAVNAGVAHLFNTNGVLLTTFVNPNPAIQDYFGYLVAAVGADRVLIGAWKDDVGATDAGAAYLFNTNGVLLATLPNPTPAIQGGFGFSVAAVGSDRVLIGAYGDDTGANDAGAAYLFSFAPITTGPSLSTSFDPQLSTLTISWPAPAEGWLLEGTNALPSVAASSWPPVPQPYQTNAETISMTFTNDPATGNQFFRLHKP